MSHYIGFHHGDNSSFRSVIWTVYSSADLLDVLYKDKGGKFGVQ